MNAALKFIFINILVLIFILIAGILSAETYIYEHTGSEKNDKTKIEIKKTEQGFFITANNDNDEDRNIYYTDDSFSIIKWIYQNKTEGTDITAERNGDMLTAKGILKNKEYKENYKISPLPLYHDFGTGLSGFVKSGKESCIFWAVDLKEKRKAKFEASIIKTGTISIAGKEVQAVCCNIRLSGFLKIFWKGGQMWFRKSDGLYIFSEKMDIKHPENTIQLIHEGK